MVPGLSLSQNSALAARIGRASTSAVLATTMVTATMMTGAAATF